jgi:hypothetical protein
MLRCLSDLRLGVITADRAGAPVHPANLFQARHTKVSGRNLLDGGRHRSETASLQTSYPTTGLRGHHMSETGTLRNLAVRTLAFILLTSGSTAFMAIPYLP